MIYQFKIKLVGSSKPPIWRKLEVPADCTFYDFHLVIQIAFGWENCHLFSFEPQRTGRNHRIGFRIEELREDSDPFWGDTEVLDADEITLDKIFNRLAKLIYLYDFGDNWEHLITLEGVLLENRDKAICTAGKGTTPPEDCGGIWGYEEIKRSFAEKDQKQMERYREWLGMDDDENWDANSFKPSDLESINRRLESM